MNTELRLNHTIAGSNKHGKSAKDIRFTNSSLGSTQSKNTSNGTTINHGAMHKQHDAKHGMICGM